MTSTPFVLVQLFWSTACIIIALEVVLVPHLFSFNCSALRRLPSLPRRLFWFCVCSVSTFVLLPLCSLSSFILLFHSVVSVCFLSWLSHQVELTGLPKPPIMGSSGDGEDRLPKRELSRLSLATTATTRPPQDRHGIACLLGTSAHASACWVLHLSACLFNSSCVVNRFLSVRDLEISS